MTSTKTLAFLAATWIAPDCKGCSKTLLEPKIIESILNGTQPPSLNIQWFTRNPLPAEWRKQQTLIRGSNQTKTRH